MNVCSTKDEDTEAGDDDDIVGEVVVDFPEDAAAAAATDARRSQRMAGVCEDEIKLVIEY